ncbi:hypothetical protein ACYX8G_19660 [Microbacterium saperdae]
MAGTATSTAAWAYKNALHDAAKELWAQTHPEILLIWGEWNGVLTVPDQVMFGDLDARQDVGPLSASNRSRDEVITLTVEFTVFRPGEVDAAKDAEQYLYDRMGELEHYVRKTNTTIGGVVRECFLTSHRTASIAYTLGRDAGYLVAAAAEFQAKIRITQ